MTGNEQKKAAKEFAERWKGRGYEKGESNLFWIDLLTHVYDVDNIADFIRFEDQVHIDKSTGFIDGYIAATKVMIEQKSIGKSLTAPILQSDGSKLNPFQQAKRYIVELPVDKHPRWVITCNFAEFLIYDMNKPNGEPERILLKDLPKEYYRLQFLVEQKSEMLKKEEQISIDAGELVGKLYNALIKRYKNPESPETLKSLNMLCVRLVFCLYAEDSQIFPKHEMFGQYLKQFPVKEVHRKLRELFKVLDMTQEQRDEYDPYMQVNLDFLPLKSYKDHIIEGNALRIDWESVVPKEKLSYIMGNPPFVGNVQLSNEQKSDMDILFHKKQGRLDYVSSWYCKAAELIQNTSIQCAFVSTNSITQGIQVPTLWGFINKNYPIHINFAHNTFIWDSEASLKAHVHVVIIGFGFVDITEKALYNSNQKKIVNGISYYLTEGADTIIESRNKPFGNVPSMVRGNQASDGGWLILDSDERKAIISKEPQAEKYIKRFMMGREFLHNEERYCLWLVGVSPSEVKKMPLVYERVKKCKESRLNAPAALTRSFAETPMLFGQRTREFDGDYIALVRVSSENRKYIPMDFLTQDTIAGDKLYIIPDGTLYLFGVLMSNVHMAWMRMFAGRLEMRYSYSTNMVYNTFPWCKPTTEQKAKIEQTAQAILDARALYPDSSLADLYDDTVMPPELRKAHQANGRAVMEAYGFWGKLNTESECVAELMKMYQRLSEGK